MSKSETKQPNEKGKIVRKIIDITLAIIIAGGAIYGINKLTDDISDIDSAKKKTDETITTTETVIPDTDSVIYKSSLVDNKEIYSGALIVVNNDIEYKGKEDTLVPMYDIIESDGTDAYSVESADVKIRLTAAKALNNMLKDFSSKTEKKDIIVGGGYRSVEFQEEQYKANPDTAAQPGHSDYHTGFSVDFSIGNEDEGTIDFKGQDEYSWFEENCYKYGFIIRYPDGKKDLTGYDYRPWHFRYVGPAHAYYIHKNNLCLEEYVDMLRKYEYKSEHLKFNDDDGNEYEAYYHPADDADQTSLAVPDAEYQISGNNTDGFIIVAKTKSANKETASDNTETTTSTSKEKDEKNEKTETKVTEKNKETEKSKDTKVENNKSEE